MDLNRSAVVLCTYIIVDDILQQGRDEAQEIIDTIRSVSVCWFFYVRQYDLRSYCFSYDHSCCLFHV